MENHHVSAAFKMLQDNKGSNIVSELTRDQFEVKSMGQKILSFGPKWTQTDQNMISSAIFLGI